MIKFIKTLSLHLIHLSEKINLDEVTSFIKAILESENIFILGTGRSGFVARAFAMRLMHLGFNVYVVGETVTPRIRENDLLIAISGSGETTSVVDLGRKAKKKVNCKVAAITARKGSKLAKLADIKLIIKGKDKSSTSRGEDKRIAPLGTLFEISSLVFLDGVVAELMKLKNLNEDDLRMRHSVLE